MKTNIDFKGFGIEFANTNDSEQADLINELGLGFHMTIKEPFDRENQIGYLADHLNKHGEWFIIQLCEAIKLKQEANANKDN